MRCKRILCAVLCAVLFLTVCCVSNTAVPVAQAKTVAEYQNELEAAKAEANDIKSKIASLKAKNAPYEQQQQALESQISAVQKEIDLYEAQVKQCIATIEERTNQLETSRAQLKQRLVAMYTTSNTELTVLLSAEDYGDYLAKAELAASVSKYDSAMITGILEAIEELELAKSQLEVSQQEIKNKKAELVEAYNTVNQIVAQYNKQIGSLNSELGSIEAEQKEIAAAIKKAQQSSSSGGSSSGGSSSGKVLVGTGQFIWPVPGCYKISSGFGSRWGRNHNGLDIISSNGTVLGKPIVAADSGTVILSKYYSGYGNCIMIDHGNGYVTLYGHMRYLSSYKVGATVTKGQTIGYVGATGNVTGPHLHFEIHLNGVRKNPINYFN